MAKKLSYSEVYSYFEKFGYKLLENEYRNSQTLMEVQCPKGHIYKVKYGNFKSGRRCPQCATEKRAEKFRLEYSFVQKYFKEEGCILVSKEYINANTPLEYICICGNLNTITFSDFKRGRRCRKCAGKRLSEKFSHDYEYVKNFFEECGCELLTDYYINGKQKLEYICNCGNKSTITFEKFKTGQRCSECRNRKIGDALRGRVNERIRGENHPNWNPEKTDEERLKERKFTEYHDWRKQVFERDNYTCQCCGQIGHDLNAHHLDGWNWCIERRLDVDNGITLCKECHDEFHSIYGKGDNTKEQFDRFLESKIIAV